MAGAKVQAMTILDLLTKPELVTAAWDYFNNVQTKDVKYIPFIKADTPAPTHLNEAILGKYREQMKTFYYDPSKYPDLPRSARHQVPDRAHDAALAAAGRAAVGVTPAVFARELAAALAASLPEGFTASADGETGHDRDARRRRRHHGARHRSR